MASPVDEPNDHPPEPTTEPAGSGGTAALPAPPARPRRVVYLGSPQLAVPTLEALVAAGYEVPLVVSRADKRRGRGGQLLPSPVKAAALRLGLEVTDRIDDVAEVDADLGVVVAYGRLIRPHLLAVLPFVNLHFSLLPRWRGAAPVERAILAGDRETGVCVMALEAALDTGPVYRRATVAVGDAALADLQAELVAVGTGLLLDCLEHGFGTSTPQTGEPTYADKIDPAELALRWDQPAEVLLRTVRLGKAWTTFRGRRLLVHRARPIEAPPSGGDDGADLAGPGALLGNAVCTAEGWIELLEVQPDGRARQAADAWRNGARPTATDRLGA